MAIEAGRREVRFERLFGRQANEAIAACPVGYLPVGCLERHGDHLPMGLDVIKAHGICCEAARELGGVVFPAHFYSGIHRLSPERMRQKATEWKNLYTDASARDHLVDILDQLALLGLEVVVLYSGHYPQCQVDMIREIAEHFAREGTVKVLDASEHVLLGEGGHAGIYETSFMLYLNDSLLDMSRIGPENYADHGWSEAKSPEKATRAKGEADTRKIVARLKRMIEEARG